MTDISRVSVGITHSHSIFGVIKGFGMFLNKRQAGECIFARPAYRKVGTEYLLFLVSKIACAGISIIL